MNFALKTTTSLPPADAEAAIRTSLAKEGFGIISEIDMAATLKEKLDQDLPPYKILGACRPALAAAAVAAVPDIGLLLPCNVVVYAGEGRTVVAALDPHAMLGLAGAAGIQDIAEDARGRLQRALDALPD